MRSFPSNLWGGEHGFLLLSLGKDKMCIVAGDSLLNCDALEKPELINPAITNKTKGCDLKRLQEQLLGKWSDYFYQVGREIIVAVVPEQYIKPIYTQYVGYSGITILQFFAQLQKWFVISNGDKLKIREYFHAPWTDTPDAHASMYAAQLDERQLKCVNFEVVILDAAKTIFFVSQMDKSGLFESKFIGNYDDEANKLLTTTGTIFVKQYNREMRRIKREAENKDYKIMAAIRGVSRRNNLGTPVPPMTADVTAQEYIAALEEKAVM